MNSHLRTYLLTLALLAATRAAIAETGRRPYEMDWAGRTNDHVAPLIDFEELADWRVTTRDAEATLEHSREQQLWGNYVGKLTYRGTGPSPEILLSPPAPVPVAKAFDAVTLWCYGNNWGYSPKPDTPSVDLFARFADAKGHPFDVHLYRVDWTEWNMLHRRLSPQQIARVRDGSATFRGLVISHGRNPRDRVIYFDNLAVFTESFPPLTFDPRPRRNLQPFPGQSQGANTGPGTLPFPTRPETILPGNVVTDFVNTVTQQDDAFVFTYTGRDGTLRYRLARRTGTWSDISAAWTPTPAGNGAPGATTTPPGTVTFRPCVDGGIRLNTPKGPVAPDGAEALGTEQQGDKVVSRWRLSGGGTTCDATFIYRLWGKSLVVDVLAPGGAVAQVTYGRAVGLDRPRLVTNPYYPAADAHPAVVVSGPAESPLFLTGNTDWYRSNASILWAANAVNNAGVTYNGGTRYAPLTNGRLNDCFERFFITVTPHYTETLPTIANPTSPWKSVTGTHLWRAHGASNRQHDRDYWTNMHRHGITQLVVTDHETMWRDGGESFTFRTRAAPGKGGDEGERAYADFMQHQLGYVYGPYNNYTDFAPVNEYWNIDRVSRTSDNQLQHAWMRCYAPKPARAVEFCARLAPEIQRKFHFSTAYCDVHTAVAPWTRVDYDARVPGAGTFTAVFYAFGEIMLLQKAAWNGPVYSEGNNHAFYVGLTDGNYAQDSRYRPAENPWLVDFDLLRLHDLGCNFGMGNPDMFYAQHPPPRRTPAERDAWLDRFLTATVAFGHPGFLVAEGGMACSLRSYYMLQQLHSRYCLSSAELIRYADADGHLLDTSHAVASGAYTRSQVVVRYTDGTVVAANGHPRERMTTTAFGRDIDLPPNGYAGWTADGSISVLSADRDGHRRDYADTPAYIYVDGRGTFTRFAKAAAAGIGICRRLGDGAHEIIPYQGAECGFAVTATQATALDKAGASLGPARLRTARGLTYVLPVDRAFSYRLNAAPTAATAGTHDPAAPTLTCARDCVVPGESVTVRGSQPHAIAIPPDARPGDRLWFEREGAFIDFTVVPLANLTPVLRGNTLYVTATSHLAEPAEFALSGIGAQQKRRLAPEAPFTFACELGTPVVEADDIYKLELTHDGLSTGAELGVRTRRTTPMVAELPRQTTSGLCLRGDSETTDFGLSGGRAQPGRITCGGVERSGITMHPPYKNGVGYAFLEYAPVDLPASPSAAFRARVGKGDGSDIGDGILYRVAITDAAGNQTVVAEKTVDTHAWIPIEADLSRWAGKTVRIKLIADVGARNDSSGDWAAWADCRIESLAPLLSRELVQGTELDGLRHAPGERRVKGLTRERLRGARAAQLRYEGKGLEANDAYPLTAELNGLDIGRLAPAHGNEVQGAFSRPVTVPLPLEAIRRLARRNTLILHNPNGDNFSIRAFSIQLELADGTPCSSDIATATYTQPPEWKHAEGIPVPADENLRVTIWFDVD